MQTLTRTLISLLLLTAPCFAQRATFYAQNVPAASGGTITLVHDSQLVSVSSGTSFSVTLSASVTAGNTLVVNAFSGNQNAYITGISAGGTCNDILDRQPFQNGGCIVPSASSTAGPISVTFNASVVAPIIDIREYHITSGGPMALDAVNDSGNLSQASPYTGSTPTLSSAISAIIDSLAPNNAVTSVAAPWATNASFPSSGSMGFADHLNTTSNAAPSWTMTGAGATDISEAIGPSPTACTNTSLMDSSGGTAAAQPTASTLGTSTFGAAVGGSSNEAWVWSVSDSGSELAYTTSAYNALLTGMRFCIGGATYSNGAIGTGGLGITYTSSTDTAVHEIIFDYPSWGPSGANVGGWGQNSNFTQSAGMWVKTTFLGTDTCNIDLELLASGNDFINAILLCNSGSLVIDCEAGASTCTCSGSACSGNSVSISTNTLYFISVLFVGGGTSKVGVYNSSGTLIGTMSITSGLMAEAPVRIDFGKANTGTVTSGRTIQMSQIKQCYLGSCGALLTP